MNIFGVTVLSTNKICFKIVNTLDGEERIGLKIRVCNVMVEFVEAELHYEFQIKELF